MAKSPERSITLPRGFLAAGGTCGIKASGKPDLALIVSRVPCAAAAVTTRSGTPGTPLKVVRRHLRSGRAQALLCNSGCANAATGDEGLANAVRSCELVAEHLVRAGVVDMLHPDMVLPASTGVIGPQLPMAKIEAGIEDLAGRLATGPQADADAARAILTTDLVTKQASVRLRIGGKAVALGGVAKGSGMIAPNMATMLVFLTTDAAVAPAALRGALRAACAATFNRMSVDGHTSPSDMVVLLANGEAGNAEVRPGGPGESQFREALTSLCADLAYQIVKDGEGATRVMRVQIEGARSVREADLAGRAVVNSPLVKAAVHGGDPNWGRIVTAAGHSGARMDPEAMSLHIGPKRDVGVFINGQPARLSERQRVKLKACMTRPEVMFWLKLGAGQAGAEWLGCDLSKEYVTINAEYTT